MEQRIACQAAIEKVYYEHRIWPQQNEKLKPAFESMITKELLQSKVENYLKKTNALKEHWNEEITGQKLQNEIKRISMNTKNPQMLKQLWTVLNNDPRLIAECLARPLVVERRMNSLFLQDRRIHEEIRQKAENEVSACSDANSMILMKGVYNEVEYRKDNSNGKDEYKVIIEGEEIFLAEEEWDAMIMRIMNEFGGEANQADDSWDVIMQMISVGTMSGIKESERSYYIVGLLSKGNNSIKIARVGWEKVRFEEWWSEQEQSVLIEEPEYDYEINEIEQFDCIDDTWSQTAGPPMERELHTTVWTGTEMIIWGGFNSSNSKHYNTGARYNPCKSDWEAYKPTSVIYVPEPRHSHKAVWSNETSQMIAWGGYWSTVYGTAATNTGGRYCAIPESFSIECVPSELCTMPGAMETVVCTITWLSQQSGSVSLMCYNPEGRVDCYFEPEVIHFPETESVLTMYINKTIEDPLISLQIKAESGETCHYEYVTMHIPQLEKVEPYSIPVSGNVEITVTGNGFDAGSYIILRSTALPADVEVDAYDIKYASLKFNAPAVSGPMLVDVCISSRYLPCSGKEVCLKEALAYRPEVPGDLVNTPFTPQIGTIAGETPVSFYIKPEIIEQQLCEVKFDGIAVQYDEYVSEGKVVAYSQAHTPAEVTVELCTCPFKSKQQCYPIVNKYTYATFGYVGGDAESIQVVNTDDNELVDFHAFSTGIQSEIALKAQMRAAAFSLDTGAMQLPFEVAGRYAFAIVGDRLMMIHTGTSEILAEGPPMLPPYISDKSYKDIDVAMVQDKNIIVVATDEYITFPPGAPWGAIVTLQYNEVTEQITIIDTEYLPVGPGSTIKLVMQGNVAYVTAWYLDETGAIMQTMARAEINTTTGEVENMQLLAVDEEMLDLEGVFNIGASSLYETNGCTNGAFDCVYYVLPKSNNYGVVDFNSQNCACGAPAALVNMPQDIAVGKVKISETEYDWRGFIVNAPLNDPDVQNNTWTRIYDLLTGNAQQDDPLSLGGITPVACEMRKDYQKIADKVFVVNRHSLDSLNQNDISIIDLGTNQLIPPGIKEIPDGFYPYTIAIQEVLGDMNFLTAARTTVEMMLDEDFTNPQKRQVLLNKLEVIEKLIESPANSQAVIANTKAFENQVDNFLSNAQRKEELISFAEALIASIE
ncbi:MAG: hypothetical protein A2Y62_16795 [Candidatus Fischerbacteria bacterium RBG_13_37_8]|uniref:IPT/TIG domain-containing protein n=1 Tax=Candidatus Fischerbacteria bacterium RBG_13_37_8 TaxID=1817863 RepID=A0A1F5V9Q5_9BACT|nr:MAG: hypothetical protein A2Y62_16795 [Candidatus Fischerbacteria bacterium RBG_13_37_8]